MVIPLLHGQCLVPSDRGELKHIVKLLRQATRALVTKVVKVEILDLSTLSSTHKGFLDRICSGREYTAG